MRKLKKNYLNQYLIQEAKINRLKQMKSINPQNVEEYEREIEKSRNLRNNIENIINSLDNSLLIELMYQKYIFGKTIEEICFILNYSERHIERLHANALDKIDIPK